jgi:hypothetical protein
MNDEARDFQTAKVMEMTKSLMLAISEAGGDPFMDFSGMTVAVLISRLAPNNIRFVYTGHPVKNETESRLPGRSKGF